LGNDTIYQSQLRSRAAAPAPAYRAALGLPLLSSVPVTDAMANPSLTLRVDTPASDAARLLDAKNLPGAPVVADNGELVGVVSANGSKPTADASSQDVIDRSYPSVPADRGMDFALDAMVSAGVDWVPVVDDRSRVVGIVAMNQVIAGYQRALRRSLHQLADVRGSSVLVEAPIGETSPFAGTTVASAPWPRGTVVLSIDRHSQLITPQPQTSLHAGDVKVAVAPAATETALRQGLDGAAASRQAHRHTRQTPPTRGDAR
jgi:CBS domain-containing protein